MVGLSINVRCFLFVLLFIFGYIFAGCEFIKVFFKINSSSFLAIFQLSLKLNI